jgi:hypothetical protein
MAVTRRPFEVHLLGNTSTSPLMRAVSPSPSHFTQGRRRSTSTPSVFTNTDVETINLDISRPSSVVHSTPPNRYSPRPDVFTSPFAPPPLPSAYATSSRGLWHQQTTSPIYASPQPLPLQSRTSMLLPVSAYAPYSIPVQLSASAQRAVYPDTSAPYRPTTPRSHPRLRSPSLSQFPRPSRSQPSLTRPHRLSSMRSASPLSSEISTPSPPRRANDASNELIASTDSSPRGHSRTSSAPDTTSPCARSRSRQPSQSSARMAMGWRPPVQHTATTGKHRQTSIDALVRAALADLLNGPSSRRTSLDGEEVSIGADEARGRRLERDEERGVDGEGKSGKRDERIGRGKGRGRGRGDARESLTG